MAASQKPMTSIKTCRLPSALELVDVVAGIVRISVSFASISDALWRYCPLISVDSVSVGRVSQQLSVHPHPIILLVLASFLTPAIQILIYQWVFVLICYVFKFSGRLLRFVWLRLIVNYSTFTLAILLFRLSLIMVCILLAIGNILTRSIAR